VTDEAACYEVYDRRGGDICESGRGRFGGYGGYSGVTLEAEARICEQV